ncbi:MAG: arsenate reductase ArsC [Bdellovibrionaceae bacterium]|nr:arsenate reductase ArsC [Pseudobdellovibrionaceae bacterium]
MKILFMCVANSARSQMAEGLAKEILGPDVEIESAGSQPKYLHPCAIAVLNEIGIDISRNGSKSISDLPPSFVDYVDYVITLCTEEVCPVHIGKAGKRLHWPFPDPAGAEEEMSSFRTVRDLIKNRLLEFKKKLLVAVMLRLKRSSLIQA